MNNVAEHVAGNAEHRRDHLFEHGIEHMNNVAEHVSGNAEHGRDHLLEHRIERMNDITEHVADTTENGRNHLLENGINNLNDVADDISDTAEDRTYDGADICGARARHVNLPRGTGGAAVQVGASCDKRLGGRLWTGRGTGLPRG